MVKVLKRGVCTGLLLAVVIAAPASASFKVVTLAGEGSILPEVNLKDRDVFPDELVVDGRGHLYFIQDFRIMEFIPTEGGVAHAIAGTGLRAFNEDRKPLATNIDPRTLAVGPDGTIYFVDGLTRIRAVDPKRSRVRTLAGTNERGDRQVGEVDFTPISPRELLVRSDGMVFFTSGVSGASQIMRLSTDQSEVRLVAGRGEGEVFEDGRAGDISIRPHGLVFGAVDEGEAFFIDSGNRIRKVSADFAHVETVAGTRRVEMDNEVLAPRDRKPLDTIVRPKQLVFSPSGELHFPGQGLIRKLSRDFTKLITVAGGGKGELRAGTGRARAVKIKPVGLAFDRAYGLVFNDSNVWIRALGGGSRQHDGSLVSTLAGTGSNGAGLENSQEPDDSEADTQPSISPGFKLIAQGKQGIFFTDWDFKHTRLRAIVEADE